MSPKRKAVDDTFLAEQVHRIRDLVDQMAQVQKSVSDNSEAVLRSRDTAAGGPLETVRDYRTYKRPPSKPRRERAHGARDAHSAPHQASVGKRRR